MKQQTNIRLNETTRARLRQMAQRYGSITAAIERAVDIHARLDKLAATYEQQGMEDALALLRLVYTPPEKEE